MSVLKARGRMLVSYDKDARNIVKVMMEVDGIVLTEHERYYVHTIVSGLKSIGVWPEIKALYGFVGGTAASHRWNWKDMRDLDEAFRLTFHGNFIHDHLGAQADGSYGSYADTHLIPSIVLETNYTHLSIYSKTNNTYDVEIDMGSSDTSSNFLLRLNRESRVESSQYLAGGGGVLYGNISSAKGYTLTSRISSNSHKIYKNGGHIATSSALDGNLTTTKIFLWAQANNASDNVNNSNNKFCLVSIGLGLSDQQAKQMSHIVSTAQGILNRK